MEIKALVHDLLNSLTVIDGNLSLALKEDGLEKVRERLRKAILANNKAVEICREKLEGSEKTLIDIKEFYELSLTILKDLYPLIEIHFEALTSDELLVDKTHFFRINENIIKNSVEAGATKLVILCENDKVSFFDNGTGMTKEAVDKIAKTGTSKEAGHGIGLCSIASFCSDHGYRMSFGNNESSDVFREGFHIFLYPKK